MASISDTPVAAREDDPTVAVGLMVFAMMLVPIGDVLSKLLTAYVPPVEIAFWRYAVQCVCLIVLASILRRPLRGFTEPMFLLGGATSGASLLFLVMAFQVMPIATAIAIFFVEPLILTVLSAVFLGEKTGWRRLTAVAVGLFGAMVVIRPGWSTFGWYAILPLIAATAFAITMIIVRRGSRKYPPLSVQFAISLNGTLVMGLGILVMTVSGASHGPTLDLPSHVWGTLAAMGALSGFTFLLVSQAFSRLPASVLAPFQYLEIVGATVLGYLVFHEFPDAITWVGTAIILASGVYVFARERRLALSRPGLSSKGR
ncbi:DMT family transporter [Acuticoccus kandeliae]|uniref:DMT family transporter n=1 Tax=Acuticoccus kandeliae TaxID=2073160 RepID=UPI001B3BDA20|nr:DMT family transporter [Acuticoccus kandeliae]